MTDRDTLAAIYKHLPLQELLKHTGLTRPELDEFFRTLKALLDQRAADAERRASLVIYIDGSAKGNPGPAGLGVLTTDHEGEVLEELSIPVDAMTNNAAEYHALIAAIGRAIEWKPRQVVFRTDSELMAKQMQGEFRIKSRNLMTLCIEARNLLKQLPNWRLEQIPREQNKQADALADIAAKESAQKAGKSTTKSPRHQGHQEEN